MEFRQLETFRAVMNTLSMTAAAKQLYLSPSAVSLQLRNLGEELQTELFVHSGHRLVPTSDAKRLQRHVDAMMDAMRAIREDFPSKVERDSRPFVLATGSTTLIYRLPGPLREIRRIYPRNDIQLQSATTQTIVSGLECKQIDLGIVSLPLEAPSVKLEPLLKEEFLVIVRAAKTRQRNLTIDLKELEKLPLVLYSTGLTERTILDRMAEAYGISLQVAMQIDCTESIKKFVEAGYGASIVPEYAVRNAPQLQKLAIKGAHPYRELALATARSAFPRKLTTEIADYLREKLGNHVLSARTA
jgi:DNA-binding transcriptional LysR family regulator